MKKLLVVCAAALALGLAPRAAVAAPAAIAAPTVPASLPLAQMPDSSELRARYWGSYFSAPLAAAKARSPSVQKSGSASFRLSVIEAKDYFYQVLSPLQGAGAAGSAGGEPVLYAQGTWILKRAASGGAPVQAKVFLRSDPGCFVRIYPNGDRCLMDLVIYGGVYNREVPLPLPFARVFAARLDEIVGWTRMLVDWKILSPYLGMYAPSRSFVAAVRSRLSSLRYADDGALDAEGRPVYIASGKPQAEPSGLNCSGFAKWVVDGFYAPLAGRYLDPLAMARRNEDLRSSSFTAPFESRLDPYFGLDWTRNLAASLADAAYPSRAHGLREADVLESAFALFAPESVPGAVNGSSSYVDYPAPEPELGYEGRGLKAILYKLAIEEPGTIYLASLSRRGAAAADAAADAVAAARVLRHYHVAVLAPYFEESGEFHVAVFESAAETSIEALAKRVDKDYVHLVRIPILPDFDPPRFR